MKIVHFEDEPWDSGLAHYALTLAAAQKARGHEVAFWGLRDSPLLVRAKELGLATRGWLRGPRGLAQVPLLRRELAALAPAVVNAHTGSAQTRALALAPRRAAVVRTRGDARPARGTPLTRAAARRTTAFIAANSAIAADLRRLFPRAIVRLVPQGVDGPDAPAPLPTEPTLGMIARMDPVKGHRVLLAAARALRPRFRGLTVVCAGDGALLPELRMEAKGEVEFPGRVPDASAFAASCRIGVVASTGSEAVSRAALEWMAAGRPLVATRVGGIPDLVEDGVTGILVPPSDPDALAEAAAALLSEPARAAAMGAAGRERWRKLFSPEPFVRETLKVYDEAIHSLPR